MGMTQRDSISGHLYKQEALVAGANLGYRSIMALLIMICLGKLDNFHLLYTKVVHAEAAQKLTMTMTLPF